MLSPVRGFDGRILTHVPWDVQSLRDVTVRISSMSEQDRRHPNLLDCRHCPLTRSIAESMNREARTVMTEAELDELIGEADLAELMESPEPGGDGEGDDAVETADAEPPSRSSGSSNRRARTSTATAKPRSTPGRKPRPQDRLSQLSRLALLCWKSFVVFLYTYSGGSTLTGHKWRSSRGGQGHWILTSQRYAFLDGSRATILNRLLRRMLQAQRTLTQPVRKNTAPIRKIQSSIDQLLVYILYITMPVTTTWRARYGGTRTWTSTSRAPREERRQGILEFLAMIFVVAVRNQNYYHIGIPMPAVKAIAREVVRLVHVAETGWHRITILMKGCSQPTKTSWIGPKSGRTTRRQRTHMLLFLIIYGVLLKSANAGGADVRVGTSSTAVPIVLEPSSGAKHCGERRTSTSVTQEHLSRSGKRSYRRAYARACRTGSSTFRGHWETIEPEQTTGRRTHMPDGFWTRMASSQLERRGLNFWYMAGNRNLREVVPV